MQVIVRRGAPDLSEGERELEIEGECPVRRRTKNKISDEWLNGSRQGQARPPVAHCRREPQLFIKSKSGYFADEVGGCQQRSAVASRNLSQVPAAPGEASHGLSTARPGAAWRGGEGRFHGAASAARGARSERQRGPQCIAVMGQIVAPSHFARKYVAKDGPCRLAARCHRDVPCPAPREPGRGAERSVQPRSLASQ